MGAMQEEPVELRNHLATAPADTAAPSDGGDDLVSRLERLNDIGAALSSQRDLPRLLERVLVAAKDITRADGGTLYLCSDDRNSLHFAILRNDSLGLAFGGSAGDAPGERFPDLPLRRPDGSPNDNLVAAYCALHACTINIGDAYGAEGFDFSGTRTFDARNGYRSRSFLTVPLKDHENEVVGVLQLINALDRDGRCRPFAAADQRLAESLASQAAVALTNRLLVAQLENLFESFISLINLAIDDKSPYTSAHCQRVPILTMMLAEAADAASEGPLADFHLTEQDRYELRIAALLHDCGKITTPVHVVDKATKLQTLFDLIELIDTRCEVLKRDAEIACLRAIAAGGDAAAARQELAGEVAEIEAGRDFLRKVNQGGENMSPADQARVQALAVRWQWTDPAGQRREFLSADEIENLTIPSGTLTEAERTVINHHIVATIRMLEALPWPKHLRNVPEYAGGHHERMDGKGYPRGLTRNQMSWQARMMGIADVFEALTAGDRPYKPAMSMDDAVQVLLRFSGDGHLDPDLVRLFLAAGLPRRYAAYLEEGAG